MTVFETHMSAALASEQETRQSAPGEIVLGNITGIDDAGQPLVDFDGCLCNSPIPALSTVSVTRSEIGRTVALLFARGDQDRPVIMGLIHNPLYSIIDTTTARAEEEAEVSDQPNSEPVSTALPGTGVEQAAQVDGERVVIEGKKEIVLKCGDASITLTSAGKVIIRGKYLLNRSSGVNRIMGGSVQVN